MKVYAYSQTTGEFLTELDATPSPLEPGKFIVMSNTTPTEPPAAQPGHTPVWTDEAWEQVEDHRMQAYYKTSDGSVFVVDRLGPLSEVAPDTTAIAPPEIPSGKRLVWAGELWALEDLPPPEIVSMRQARLALLSAGMLETINAAVAAMPGTEGEAARIEWEYAQDVRRDNPLLGVLVAQLGMDEAVLDALFRVAVTL